MKRGAQVVERRLARSTNLLVSSAWFVLGWISEFLARGLVVLLQKKSPHSKYVSETIKIYVSFYCFDGESIQY